MKPFINSLRWNPSEHTAVRKHGVYVLHGTGEHAARYEALAQQLTRAGYQVGAHDHPGHGQSAGKRGVIDPPGALVTQAAIQIQQFAAQTGHLPIVFGHSLGGVAATELVLEHHLEVAGLILSAPAFEAIARLRDRLQVKVLARVAPLFTVERPYSARRLTSDETKRTQAEADPLNHGFKSASLVDWLFNSGKRQLNAASSLKTDTLLMIPADDSVVSVASMQSFADAAGDHVSVKLYENCLHEIFQETPEKAQRACDDVESWLVERYPALRD